MGRYLIVWAIELSNVRNQEQKYTSALGGRQTNENATMKQKNAGSMGERWDMRPDRRGALGGGRDLIVLGQSSWDKV
jgi:hypothetical protein